MKLPSVKLFLLVLIVVGHIYAGEYKLGGYYRSWAQGQFTPNDIDFEQVTHLFHAFAWPTANGDLQYDYDFLNLSLIQKTHHAHRKILLSLGGATNSDGFSPMAADDNARSRFIEKVVNFIQKYQYDGVDIDWEFPESATDRINMVKLVNELRKKMDSTGESYLLTMAIPVGDWFGQWFQFDVLKNIVDWFNAMTYDFHGSWTNHAGHNAPLYSPSPAVDNCGSVDEGIKYLVDQRALPPEKILLGLAFYGRQFNTSGLYHSSSGGDATFGYADIVPLIGNGWVYHWDTVCKVPYLTNNAGNKLFTYDDTVSIKLKCEYALNTNLVGCMIWALGHDKIGDSQPLLNTAANVLKIQTGFTERPNPEIPGMISLKVFPNPFNTGVKLELNLKRNQSLCLQIFDLSGRLITQLLDAPLLNQGKYVFYWNAAVYASGAYIVLVQNQHQRIERRIVLIK